MKRFTFSIPRAGINHISSTKRQRILYSTSEGTDNNMSKSVKGSGEGFVTLKDIPSWNESERDISYKSYKYLYQYFRDHGKLPEIKASTDSLLNSKISLWQGDITSLEIDAIVNAANNSLLGGGGVDGCIHRRAGSELRKECSLLNGCSTGDAKITKGHKLPAKHIIHTVGPVGKKPDVLQSCYKKCLEIVKKNKLTSVAFCCISTGIYGYPNKSAAHVALKTTREWLQTEDNASLVQRIIFCVFLPEDLDIYERLIPMYFPSDIDSQNREKVINDSDKGKQEPKDGSKSNKNKEQKQKREMETDTGAEGIVNIKEESVEAEGCKSKGKGQDVEEDHATKSNHE